MKAAIYARFSTNKQSEDSIEDQMRNCQRYADSRNWQIAFRFEDRAISGASKERSGYQSMLEAAEKGFFKILIVDDLSRLNRDELAMKMMLRQFKFKGLRVIAVSDGYDSDNKGEKIQATMRGLMNELYLDDLRDKTHRGLTGKVLNGFSAGGSVYGYQRVPIEHPTKTDPHGRPEIMAVRREINEEEAVWVQQIFEWFAKGRSPKWMASELNRLKVLSPRKSTWAPSAIYGDATDYTGIALRNKWVIDNPCDGFKRNNESPRERYFTIEEIIELWKALDKCKSKPSANAIKLLIMTGARKSEVLSSTWEQFDFKER